MSNYRSAKIRVICDVPAAADQGSESEHLGHVVMADGRYGPPSKLVVVRGSRRFQASRHEMASTFSFRSRWALGPLFSGLAEADGFPAIPESETDRVDPAHVARLAGDLLVARGQRPAAEQSDEVPGEAPFFDPDW